MLSNSKFIDRETDCERRNMVLNMVLKWKLLFRMLLLAIYFNVIEIDDRLLCK